MKTKSRWTSKTNWFNTVLGVVGILAASSVIPVWLTPYLMLVQTLGNYMLREITKHGIGEVIDEPQTK